MNATVTTTSITQSANVFLGKEETNLYYLIIETPNGRMTINVGKKTHDGIVKLTTPQGEPTQEKNEDKPNLKGGKK